MTSSRLAWPATRASAACAVLVVTAATGCAAGGTTLDENAPVATTDWDASQDRMSALLEGELSLQDGCVYVVQPGLERVLPVFPEDRVGWDPDAETLSYGGVDYSMGDAIAAGGGWSSPPESASIPDACEPDEWGDVMLVQDESIAPMSDRGY